MIKSDIIAALSAEFTSYSERKVAGAVNDIINMMRVSLAEGKRIEIRGFGSFSLRYRAARKARNPKTGKELETMAKYSPHFKVGKGLKDRVNANAKAKGG
ncbi:MAG: integration host factor subunit beta [Legionellales bacterium]|nr:integration host factor subunit beta [Legionellales bacterium]